MEWVVLRTTGAVAVSVLALLGTTGRAYIEWDVALDLSRGDYIYRSFPNDEYVEMLAIYLSSTARWDIELAVPPGCDYDLYLYYMPNGEARNALEYLNCSANTTLGAYESILNLTVPFTGWYAALVTRVSGNTSFGLTYDYTSDSNPNGGDPISGFGGWLLYFPLFIVLPISILWRGKFTRGPYKP